MTKISFEERDIMNIYRSAGANSLDFIHSLTSILDLGRYVMIVGDFNICALTECNHMILKHLSLLGFRQEVMQPTQLEGRVIDHVYSYAPDGKLVSPVKVHHKSPYFTDHDLLFIEQARNFYYHSLQYLFVLG